MLCPVFIVAQTANDILEKGIRVDKSNGIRLRFNGSVIKYKSVENNAFSYLTLDPASYYLSGDQVNVYLSRLNPLNYSQSADVTTSDDAISKAEDAALQTIIKSFTSITKAPGGGGPPTIDFDFIQGKLDAFKKDLDNSNKKDIGKEFTKLKGVSFENVPLATATIAAVKNAIDAFTEKYSGYKGTADQIQGYINSYTETGTPPAHDVKLAKPFF